MTARREKRVFSISPGVPFLPTLADAFLSGGIVPDFQPGGDPLALADATIYLPTRRAARELRSAFVDRMGGRQSAILPVIRPLGEFDEDAAAFEREGEASLDLAPPIPAMERILLLAPLVQAWKSRVPAHVAERFSEGVVVPASASDAIWLARDLAALLDEIETEEADWSRLGALVSDDLAGWWQVTLDFLRIVTSLWPQALEELQRSNPAAHRNALLAAEAARLSQNPPAGPVIAAGSTGSIPATARLLAAIASLPRGAVVLPGLDGRLDEPGWAAIGDESQPSAFGHPQFGLRKLLGVLGVERSDVIAIGAPAPALAARNELVSDALRPAETTDAWALNREAVASAIAANALCDMSLVEAANEREQALAIAVALRLAIEPVGATAALVTPDRDLARRVSAELRRFGIQADDSGGRMLAETPAAVLMRLMLECVFRPGDPVVIVGLLKHPLLTLGFNREKVRSASETIELVALRGGTGRPDLTTLGMFFEQRFADYQADEEAGRRTPFWWRRIDETALGDARDVLSALAPALAPLQGARGGGSSGLGKLSALSVAALEDLARGKDDGLSELYRDDAGEALVSFLGSLVGSSTSLQADAGEWPDIVAALIATETVKPPAGSDPRIFIWGALEARLQHVDTLVLGGLSEGVWPRVPAADRFMSRLMKGELDIAPPERRIGLAAHDFMMAMGAPKIVLTRSARSGDAPAVASRWLQRLLTCVGGEEADALRARGNRLIGWARALYASPEAAFAPRPEPAPPLEARPAGFSVTEIETLRRDPYAVYAKKILGLQPLDPLIRDPGAAERGTLFHEILSRLTKAEIDPGAPEALAKLVEIGRAVFDEEDLPSDVRAIWWPRFEKTAAHVIDWERRRRQEIATAHAEIRANPHPVGTSGKTLSGYADRIDLRHDGSAGIIDYKTGSSPSRGQAHTLLAPQLALEAALLARGAFKDLPKLVSSDLAYVRLKANGDVTEETILKFKGSDKSAPGIAEEAWSRLEQLLAFYDNPQQGYRSRALPFREGDFEGDYDHLARVLEWSAGGDDAAGGEESG